MIMDYIKVILRADFELLVYIRPILSINKKEDKTHPYDKNEPFLLYFSLIQISITASSQSVVENP